MGFRVNTPAIVNVPPTIDSAPAPVFTVGTGAEYAMSQHVTDDGLTTLIYGLTGTLATGLSFNTTTGVLTYDGVGAASGVSHQLTLDDQVNTIVTSNPFNVTINAAAPVGDITPLMHWDYSTEQLSVNRLPEITNIMRTHAEGSSTNAIVSASEDTPLRTGGGRYLFTSLIK